MPFLTHQCSILQGGETAILKGDGSIARVIGPQLGSAVMMQGGYIKHAAMPCSGASERLTMVSQIPIDRKTYS